jgi:hypothetical protein
VSPRVQINAGTGVVPLMKFTLTYEGRLPASANKSKREDVWRIRKDFHPQLVDLWDNHPALTGLMGANETYPLDGALMTHGHHLHPGPIVEPYLRKPIPAGSGRGTVNLNAPIIKHGRMFLPLVRENYATHCGLKINFLRHEAPGKVYQGGDIDGRIKTLLDALTMPQHVEQVLEDAEAPEQMFCLMEEDSMVSGLQIESERLLSGQNQPNDFVKLVIEVDVRVRFPMSYNQLFLGG